MSRRVTAGAGECIWEDRGGRAGHRERSFRWFLLLVKVKSADAWKPVKFLPREEQPDKSKTEAFSSAGRVSQRRYPLSEFRAKGP